MVRLSLLVCAVFALSVYAGPAFLGDPSVKTGGYDENLSLSAAWFSAAAYCDKHNIASWACGTACEKHPAFDVEVVFYTTIFGNTNQVFLGYDPTGEQYVISFEGTHEPEQLVEELLHIE
jgi:hypothetical protein